MDESEIIWRPDPEAGRPTRIARFMKQHGLASLEALQRRSIAEPEWYWDAVARDLGWAWAAPYAKGLDTQRGIQWPRWFAGGRMNLAANCVDRQVAPPGGRSARLSPAGDGRWAPPP